MFILNQSNIWLNLAAYLVMWIIIGFMTVIGWCALIELNIKKNTWLERRANKRYFKSIEELQNDFI